MFLDGKIERINNELYGEGYVVTADDGERFVKMIHRDDMDIDNFQIEFYVKKDGVTMLIPDSEELLKKNMDIIERMHDLLVSKAYLDKRIDAETMMKYLDKPMK